MGSTGAVAPVRTKVLLRQAVGLALAALGVLGLLASAWLFVRAPRPVAAAPVRVTPWVEPGLGVNVDLAGRSGPEIEAIFQAVDEANLDWVRQPFRWADLEPEPGQLRWEESDAVVEAVAASELEMIAVLGTTPPWARPPGQENAEWTAPADYAAFGDFVARFAERYGDRVTYYQIWDQPNIYPYWGDRYVDPEEYGRLLREAATRIRAADDDAVILLAGLAPNVEEGPLNLNEVEYLRRVLRSGAGPYFDVAAAKAYGFEVGPEDPRLDVRALNFGRVALLRQVLEEEGRAQTPVWAVEFGWNALPSDWSGEPAPWGTGAAGTQALRSAQAVTRARQEWPWMGPMLWARLLPPENPADPGYGFALLEEDLSPTAFGRELLPLLGASAGPSLGWQQPSSPAATYSPGWRVSDQGADPSAAGDWVEIAFRGTALDLSVRPGPFWAVWYVEVDGRPSDVLPTHEGRSYVVLYDPLGQERLVTVASGLPPGEHRVRITVEGGWGQWPLGGWVSRQEFPPNRAPLALALSVAALAAGIVLGRPDRLLARALRVPLQVAGTLPEVVPAALAYGAGLIFWAVDGLPLSVVAGGVLALVAVAAPRWILSLALASLPFFLVPKSLAGASVPVTEMLAWLLLVGCVTRSVLGVGEGRERLRLTALDVAVAGLVVSASLATLAAPLPGVALHDLRRVIIGGAVLYAGTRLVGGRALGPAAVGVLLGAAAAAAVGISQYVRGEDLIQAGEVARVRGLYGSPNNLALYLGRSLPLAAALALLPSRTRARVPAAIVALLCLAAGILTRSRGLVLLGIPVGLSIVLWHWEPVRRRRAWIVPGVAVALVLVALLAGGRVRGLLTGTDPAATMRLYLWVSSAQMIQDRPLLGVGPDNFLYQYRTRYILPSAWQEPNLSHPHNVVLDFWLTAGLGGVLVLGALLVWGTAYARRALRGSTGWRRAAYLGISACLLAALAQGMVDNSLFLVDLSHLTLGYLALLANAVAPLSPAGERASSPAVIPPRGWAA
jgi:O-antigen ligase